MHRNGGSLSSEFPLNAQNHPIIEIDAITDMAKESLPFDQGFVLKKAFNDSIEIIGIGFYEIKASELKNYFNTSRETELTLKYKFVENEDNKFELYIYVPPLKPQKFYDFLIVQKLNKENKLIDQYINFFHELNNNRLDQAKIILNTINLSKKDHNDPFEHIDYTAELADIGDLSSFYLRILKPIYDKGSLSSDQKTEQIRSEILKNEIFKIGIWFTSTSEIFSFETRAKHRITPDFGYVYYGFQEKFSGISPYLGFQLEFRYFDKKIRFNLIPNKTLWHRLSFNSGILLASLKKDGKREDLLANKSLLMGFGLKLSNALRLTGGTILFNKENPNPLIDDKKIALTPYIGLSIDLSLKELLNDITGLIPLNRK